MDLLWPAFAALIGVAIWWWNAPSPRTARQLLQTPTRDIGTLVADRPDCACFVGTVTNADGLVEAPFSGERSVALAYEVLEEEPTTRTGPNPMERVASGSAAEPFTLDDGTGKLRVDPRGATFRLAPDTNIEVEGGATPPQRIQRYIDADDSVGDEDLTVSLGPLDLPGGYDRRYIERRVDPGDRVLVCGAIEDDRSTVGRRPEAGTVPVTLAGGEPFLLADASKRSVVRGLLVGNPVWFLLAGLCFVVAGVGLWTALA